MNYTAQTVAQWMYKKIKNDASLQQDVTAQYILDNFGDEFTYINENGNLAISKAVLKEFKKLHQGHAVWYRRALCWEWE